MIVGLNPFGLYPMRALLVVVIAALCAWSTSAAAGEPAPKEMVLLTVSGLVGESNRGPLDAKKDSLLAAQKIDFPKAFAFHRAMLLALPQGTVTATTRELGAPATFTGPLLREVLGHRGDEDQDQLCRHQRLYRLAAARGCRWLQLDSRARG
jgi:hypothetical protein